MPLLVNDEELAIGIPVAGLLFVRRKVPTTSGMTKFELAPSGLTSEQIIRFSMPCAIALRR